MYDRYFNLSGLPFRLSPDPRFYFEGETHRKAKAYLTYGLNQGEGFVVVTGPIGAGKTMLIRQMLGEQERRIALSERRLAESERLHALAVERMARHEERMEEIDREAAQTRRMFIRACERLGLFDDDDRSSRL